MAESQPASTVEPLLIGKAETARLVGISPRSLDRLVCCGKFMRPVRLGGRVLFDRSVLERWVRDGCRPVAATGRAGGGV